MSTEEESAFLTYSRTVPPMWIAYYTAILTGAPPSEWHALAVACRVVINTYQHTEDAHYARKFLNVIEGRTPEPAWWRAQDELAYARQYVSNYTFPQESGDA